MMITFGEKRVTVTIQADQCVKSINYGQFASTFRGLKYNLVDVVNKTPQQPIYIN